MEGRNILRNFKTEKELKFWSIVLGIILAILLIWYLLIKINNLNTQNKELKDETRIEMFDEVELYAKELELKKHKKEILDGLNYKESVSFSQWKTEEINKDILNNINSIDEKIKLYREIRGEKDVDIYEPIAEKTGL